MSPNYEKSRNSNYEKHITIKYWTIPKFFGNFFYDTNNAWRL